MSDRDVALPGARADVARIDASVHGRVQGVGFRWFVLDVARGLDLRGWVANDLDGSVRCVAEGARRTVRRWVEALGRGPLNALVDRVIPLGRPSGTLGRFEIPSHGHGCD